jgi:hypothetical protein
MTWTGEDVARLNAPNPLGIETDARRLYEDRFAAGL